ncbi:sugar phosphate isomerase/epimerase family protein [Clostridium omnivorum]|uniref:AP endonuclease n=1 Tax=Clostridium omnivorum TaxID=1604902 RepID=A0ABQ5N8I8_9CLOT|nr:sugar phosphate isomerase/epimerase [Clostridium sp. E14]GLC31456.1 AP endonuclease [Clostridium sp. E14]
MEIGLSSASFYPEVNTEDSIALMKKIGFDFGEIFLNSPSEYEEEFIKMLLEKVETNSFRVNSVHAFGSQFEPYLFDKYKRRREDMVKYFKNICRAGSMLGAKCYVFHGMRLESFEIIDKNLVIDIYNELSYIALENGIKLAQENVSWCMSSNIKFLEMLKEKCKYPVYFTIDIKQAYKSGIEPNSYIDIMGKDIINFHINDRDDKNVCLLPGRGTVDYESIINKLKEVEYKGPAILEVYRSNYRDYAELLESKLWTQKHLQM